MAGALSESEDAVNSCKLAGQKRCKNASVIAKAQTAAITGDLYTNLCAGFRQQEFRQKGTRIAALCDVYTDFHFFRIPNPTHYANSQKRPQTKRSFNETRSA